MSERDTFNRHLLHPWAFLPELAEDDTTPVIVRGDGVYICLLYTSDAADEYNPV